jgi:RNA polymerase sigma-70 factor, ECF subfamily
LVVFETSPPLPNYVKRDLIYIRRFEALNASDEFHTHRRLLFSIAYKMTGSVADSEDILQDVQEKWLRISQPVRAAKAYLAKAVTNTSLNYLRAKQKEREQYFGLWLPEPYIHPDYDAGAGEDQELQVGFMLLLEKLSPLERAVYLLREGFTLSYPEIARNFDIKEDYCRQLYHRARERLHARRRFRPDPEQQEKILTLFESACRSGDLSLLINQLKDDVSVYSDGGGKVPAAVNTISGKGNVSKFLEGIYRKNGVRAVFRFQYLNESPTAIVFLNGVPDTVALLEMDENGVSEMYVMRNPEKIRHLQKYF